MTSTDSGLDGRMKLAGDRPAPCDSTHGLAHHPGPSAQFGHLHAFAEATVERGQQATEYFRTSGIAALAEANHGLCTFQFGREIALYQLTNEPVIDDDLLTPSTAANHELFGSFMGSLPSDHPDRPAKRAAIERSLGSGPFVESLADAVRAHAASYLADMVGRTVSLEEFSLGLVSYVESLLPGVLDLSARPLPSYLASAGYGEVLRTFFDLASEVISKANRDAMREIDMIVPFVRELLLDNLEPLSSAADTNLIRRYFSIWECPLDKAGIQSLTAEQLKELGTIIVATFDTTALSLLWTLAYLQTTPSQQRRVLEGLADPAPAAGLSVLDLVVLEAVRRGGSNPTALWRRSVAPFDLQLPQGTVTVSAGTMLWLDRRQANHDPNVFPHADEFDVDNIAAIKRSDRETVSSMLARGRYELNSFSMINTNRNPRKCPGRLFSVRLQALLLAELYSGYDVATDSIDTSLRRFSSMPRPSLPGTIRITPRSEKGRAS